VTPSAPHPRSTPRPRPSILSFSDAFERRRCIIPADGFYEWTGPKERRQPIWIHPHEGGLLLFAGLYESWYPEPRRPTVTFTIITCPANATISTIHDRMPVVLDEAGAEGLDESARADRIAQAAAGSRF
jgi:putative SOS response-associated peptidase YedK